MLETQNTLIDFLEKAYNLTTQALKLVQNNQFEELNQVLNNRERIINIIDSLSEQLALHQRNREPSEYEAFNNQLNQVIQKIQSIDEIITNCLEHEKNKTQFEIAKTFKNKENFRGYNLNNIK